jgi:hydrogenase maturation protease
VSVLVAGIGNVFFGDDGFGVEVARRLAAEGLPDGAEAIDYGIRCLHLAFRLLEPVDLLVVADAVRYGNAPGTLYLIAPELEEQRDGDPAEGHGMSLPAVFAAVRSMGGAVPRVLVVGCEPARVDEGLGLSEAVAAAVGPAVARVRAIVDEELTSAATDAAREAGDEAPREEERTPLDPAGLDRGSRRRARGGGRGEDDAPERPPVPPAASDVKGARSP